ncbi:hypothetical protein [Pseudarthrobacter sp. BIM B-2242]|uniref:hypothetical protein n=1 Tax=Pseudarthrobacter sp. BIM B-2242 TaxID=2772401 RepID=UPI00168AC0D3|nr:hypothetical protein [Pseudarthrobacter sp. BIM B-2242]QOD04978.1 hypothetical protein IDT60_08205 [Pseudarthrobacter sp. BIM B-2242]
MRIELEGPKEAETPASLVAIDTYRQQLGVQKARRMPVEGWGHVLNASNDSLSGVTAKFLLNE